MIRNEDSLWKGLMEDQFLDFIHFLQPNAGEILDFGRGYEFLDILTNNIKTMGLEEQIKEMIRDKAKMEGLTEGRAEGQKELKEKFAQKLIKNLGYTDRQIADLVEVPLNFVKKLRNQKVAVV